MDRHGYDIRLAFVSESESGLVRLRTRILSRTWKNPKFGLRRGLGHEQSHDFGLGLYGIWVFWVVYSPATCTVLVNLVKRTQTTPWSMDHCSYWFEELPNLTFKYFLKIVFKAFLMFFLVFKWRDFRKKWKIYLRTIYNYNTSLPFLYF